MATLDMESKIQPALFPDLSATYATPSSVEATVKNPKTVYVSATGSDTDSGATWGKAKASVSAALGAAGTAGSVELGDGRFSISSTLALDVNNSIKGQGSMRTTLAVDFDGVGIDWKPQVTFSGRAAGTLSGFSLVSGAGAGINACGLRISSLVKPKIRDIRVANFTGTSGIGFWFQNIAIGGTRLWTERLDVQGAVAENNTISVCFDVNGGTNSFMYAEALNFTVNVNAVPAGSPAQIGYLLRNGAALLGCDINFMGNVAGVNGANTVVPTFLRLQDNLTNIVNSSLSIRGEMTSGTAGTSVSIGTGSKILGNTGVIAFVNSTGFTPVFEAGHIFGHSGTIAGNGFGNDVNGVDKRYLLSTTREPGATGGVLFNRTAVSASSPLFAMVSHPPNIGSAGYSDQDLIVTSYDGTTFQGYLRYRYTASGPQVHSLGAFVTRQGGTLGTKTFTSGAGTQLTGAGDRHVVVPVTFNATAGAAATCLVELSPDNVTYTALGTWTKPANSTAGQVELVHIEVPHGWYARLTVSNATLGTATYY
ncbi:hypothetical protein [Arthrobacter sp. ISL-5]|uniref:hypothetical protein n=1 Tax=Arthrobacter sp. ISL-5 TaxID=2819111 RepID=UPI001BE4E782|nr:hypothetical protein [Arthrobacter sp. ISL-5]MBT2552804.1 hypothetical protein [Arthrobacter sp. ISL-5]